MLVLMKKLVYFDIAFRSIGGTELVVIYLDIPSDNQKVSWISSTTKEHNSSLLKSHMHQKHKTMKLELITLQS